MSRTLNLVAIVACILLATSTSASAALQAGAGKQKDRQQARDVLKKAAQKRKEAGKVTEAEAVDKLKAELRELQSFVKQQKSKAGGRPGIKTAWTKAGEVVQKLRLEPDHDVVGISGLRSALNRVGSAIDKLPSRVQGDLKKPVNQARKRVDSLLSASKLAKERAAAAAREAEREARAAARKAREAAALAGDSARATAAALREEFERLGTKGLEQFYESIGKPVLAQTKQALEQAEEISEEQIVELRAASERIREAKKDVVELVRQVHEKLNRPGVPAKVSKEVLAPLARGEITSREAFSRLQTRVGTPLKDLWKKVEGEHWTLTINGTGSASAGLGIETNLPLGAPGYALGALRDAKDEFVFAYVWNGGGKLGYTAEIAGGVAVGVWKARPEDLTGLYTGFTLGGGGKGLSANFSTAWDWKLLRDAVRANRNVTRDELWDRWLGFSLSGSVSGGLDVEGALTAGATGAIAPGKVLERIRSWKN